MGSKTKTKEAKKVKKEAKEAKKAMEAKEVEDHCEHEWLEATALQMLIRELEVEALSAYVTDPYRFDDITKAIGKALHKVAPDKKKGNKCSPSCPTGWYCCCGRCKAQGSRCGLCLAEDE